MSAASRARKVATIRSFYKYLTLKAGVLETNPVLNLDSPKLKKNLPRYLTEDESIALLKAIDGNNRNGLLHYNSISQLWIENFGVDLPGFS